jgi:hypothetical protein
MRSNISFFPYEICVVCDAVSLQLHFSKIGTTAEGAEIYLSLQAAG